jgi:multidrug efflux pump subunit AcrA (membrane-fusion protein)
VKDIAVRLKLEATDPRLLPNYSVSADILLGEETAPAIVPNEALYAGDGRSFVYVRNHGEWEQREVEPGLSNHVVTAIHSGLESGAVIALERPALASAE